MNYPTKWKTYEEKQVAKLERYQELAQKAKLQSQSAYETSNRLSDMIPFGQPILVGHHSERMHRRHIDKIQNAMRKSIELKDKAEYYKNKIHNIKNNNAISSDDPGAVDKLKTKLINLEELREEIKKREHQSWELSNLSQNIRQVKKRIEYLQEQQQVPETEETINGVVLKVDKSDNRVRLYFSNVPNEEIRTKLKHNGFKWSPYNKAWQRMISDWAISLARLIAQETI